MAPAIANQVSQDTQRMIESVFDQVLEGLAPLPVEDQLAAARRLAGSLEGLVEFLERKM